MPRFNPFRPGSIVTAGMFSGRVNELLLLEKALFQAKNGNPDHFVIFGERGIGKSSLLYYTTIVAKGEIPSLEEISFRFLVISIERAPANTYKDIITKVGAELQRTVANHEKTRELLKSAWDFLSRWEAFGISYKAADPQRETAPELLEDLIHTTEQVLSRASSEIDGLLLLIDEAEKPSADAHLGQFVKLLTEGLNKRGQNKFLVGLAGLPTIESKLRSSHESSLRIFRFAELKPLEWSERKQVVRKGLAAAASTNGYETKITVEAENVIATLSEGYPHFIQQFAYSAFERDRDNNIDLDDVLSGAFEKNGALQQLGRKYFENLYFDKIGSEEYRKVLRAMAVHFDEWVHKKDIQKETKLKPTTLDNALMALKTRNIILPQRGKKRVYRLPSRSFATWMRAYTHEPPSPVPPEKIEPSVSD